MRPGLRLSGAFCAAAILAFTTAMPPEPATAQGLFDFLFNAFRRPPPSYADPNARPNARDDQPEQPARRSGGGLSYCVRLCDGRHFPINYRRGAEAAEICSALCPAASTKVFSGSTIDTAVASDGRSYKDLPAAFTYRSEVVSGCTCNGKDVFGLAQIDAEKDPTLQPGDIVATSQGFVVAGRTRQSINFSPLRGEMRSKLFAVKIAPGRGTTKGRPGSIRIKAGTGQPPADENLPDRAGRIVRSVGPAPFPVGAAATDGRGRREGPDDEP
ncbi:MAG: DUF2865 domain-containing protein [Pseudorhodoplanes sp.]|nr:DUF2865 domain-containing protein [Pseudorhodoplanes sp.]